MSAAGTLVLAWGNPGRRDDGLGPAVAAALEALALPGVAVETGYQLEVEDAAELARYGRVLFVDADRAGEAPFQVRRLEPE
ncbi:MAG: hydrogenase maturation protease, partial [Thermoanaerobaculia bacterium]|nr:hydrogenase maturation protease [Thermoanaerobaculia bacterium]